MIGSGSMHMMNMTTQNIEKAMKNTGLNIWKESSALSSGSGMKKLKPVLVVTGGDYKS